MKPITTKDSSITYYSDKYKETYHSISGAIEESFKKFVEPCKVKDYKEIKILDICFGLGYNSAAAIEEFLKYNPEGKIEIIALENDLEILNKIKDLLPDLKYYYTIKKLVENKEKNIFNYKNKNITIKLLLGDAQKTIKNINTKFDAIFLDPFSPKKHPELWSLNFFKDIKELMKTNTTLATYSCARTVRDNFKALNLKVKDGPSIGRKAPSTIISL